MTTQTKAIVTEHQKALSNPQLLAQLEALHTRKKKLLQQLREKNCALYRIKYSNAETWILMIEAELEARLDEIPITVFLDIIESDFTFSILD